MCTENERANHARELVKDLLSYSIAYHNHKEVMAHAAIVLQVGVFAWIMSKNGWELIEKGCGILLFIIIWLLIHLYMRWELRNRRWAAKQVDGLRTTLGRWSIEDIEQDELQVYQDRLPRPHGFWRLCDHLIPCFSGGLTPDHAARRGYPRGLVDDLRRARVGSLYFAEWLVTGASWLMLVIVAVRRI